MTQSFLGYELIPETVRDGFAYGSITALGEDPERGAGFLEAPDGSRAGIQWELSDTPYIAKLEGPDGTGWGIYRVGFTRPVTSVADLMLNLEPLLPKFRILHGRIRTQIH